MAPPLQYRVDKTALLWGLETDWGQAINADKRFGLVESATLPDPDEGWRAFFGIGSTRNRDTILRGPIDLRGSIPDIVLQSATCPDVLALPIGRLDAGTVQEGLSATDGRLNSFTMVAAARDTAGSYSFVRQYVGGKVNRATISSREGEDLRLNLDEVIFKDIRHNLSNMANEASVPYADPGIDSSSRFLFNGAQISFGGVTVCALRNFSLTVDNQLTPRRYMCYDTNTGNNPNLSQVINDLQEGRRVYSAAVGIDLLSADTDLILFQFLMDQSGPSPTNGVIGHTNGFQLLVVFYTTPGEGDGHLSIIGAINPTQSHPGTVVRGGKINIPAPPTTIFPGDYTLDISDVQIPTQGLS